MTSGVSRRAVLAASAVATAAPLVQAEDAAARPRTFQLTVLGTSDTHGNVYNWDYYRDAEYDDSAHNDVGVAKLAGLTTTSTSAGRWGTGSPACRSAAPMWPPTHGSWWR
jgi:2',3'-cyclic-nucleotide 2'-phosphodiesterase/3'-nucleotidase